MKKIVLTIVVAAVAILGFVSFGDAAVLDINSGGLYEYSDDQGLVQGEGYGRGIGFLVNDDFHLNSYGIYGSLSAQSYDVVIYSSVDGYSAGSELASYSASLAAAGVNWNTIATNYDFTAGNYYVVNWRPTVSSSSWTVSPGIEQHYDSQGWASYDLGILTFKNGFEGSDAGSPGNTLYVRSLLNYDQSGSNSVPEPLSLVLFGSGLGVAALRRRSL